MPLPLFEDSWIDIQIDPLSPSGVGGNFRTFIFTYEHQSIWGMIYDALSNRYVLYEGLLKWIGLTIFCIILSYIVGSDPEPPPPDNNHQPLSPSDQQSFPLAC